MSKGTWSNSYIHSADGGGCHARCRPAHQEWGAVSCPRPLWHADQRNWTSNLLIKRCWLPLWATATPQKTDRGKLRSGYITGKKYSWHSWSNKSVWSEFYVKRQREWCCSRCGTNICKHETHLTFLRETLGHFFQPGRDTIVRIYTPVDFNSLRRVCWRDTTNDDYWCWRSCKTTFVRVTNNIDISAKSVISCSHYMVMMWGSTRDHSISTLGSVSTMDISEQTSGKFPGLIVGTNRGTSSAVFVATKTGISGQNIFS